MYDPDVKITTTDMKAKKTHTCNVCDGIIEVGEVYTLMAQSTWNGVHRCRHKNFRVCLMHDVKNIKIQNGKLYEI